MQISSSQCTKSSNASKKGDTKTSRQSGRILPRKRRCPLQTKHVTTIPKATNTMMVKMGATVSGDHSKIKCRTSYDRGRRKNNIMMDMAYLATIPDNERERIGRIETIFNDKHQELKDKGDQELITNFLLSSMDILRCKNPSTADVINYEILCFRSRVPSRVQHTVLKRTCLDFCRDCSGLIELSSVDESASCVDCGLVVYTDTTLNPVNSIIALYDSDEHRELVHKHIYDRMTHLKSHMALLQGIGGKVIPDEVLQVVKDGVPDQCITKMKKILQNNKMGKYYPHRVRIAAMLWGYEPPQYTYHERANVILRFADVCERYDRWVCQSDSKRKNFMSYPFVLTKLNIITGVERMNTNIIMMKNRKCVQRTQTIWDQLGLPNAYVEE